MFHCKAGLLYNVSSAIRIFYNFTFPLVVIKMSDYAAQQAMSKIAIVYLRITILDNDLMFAEHFGGVVYKEVNVTWQEENNTQEPSQDCLL